MSSTFILSDYLSFFANSTQLHFQDYFSAFRTKKILQTGDKLKVKKQIAAMIAKWFVFLFLPFKSFLFWFAQLATSKQKEPKNCNCV